MSGMASTGNSTSTTGPITRAMRPTLAPPAWVVSSMVAVMSLLRYSAPAFASASALTPPTISLISWVMPA